MHRRPPQASAVGGASGSNNGSFGSLSNSGKRTAPRRHGRSDGQHGIEGPNRTSAAHHDYDDDELGDDDDHPLHEPTPAVVRRAPASLPGPLRAVLQFAIFDTLLEDDDFLTVIRKVLLTVAALFGVFMPGYGAVFLALHGATAANITFALAAAVFFEFVPLFAYVRVTRRVPERAMLATMAAALVALALGAASAPHVPFGTFIGLWAMTMAIIDAPLIAAWYAAAAPALGLAAYNEALQVRHEGAAGYDGTPALIGGFDLPTVAERMALHFGAAVIVVCMALVVKAVNGESQFQIAKAKKSAVLARLVSGQLARYQTERAQFLLQAARTDPSDNDVSDHHSIRSLTPPSNNTTSPQYHVASSSVRSFNRAPTDSPTATGTHVTTNNGTATDHLQAYVRHVRGADADLVDALADIAVNLEKYRPHLPNWLVQEAMADVSEQSERSASEAGHGRRGHQSTGPNRDTRSDVDSMMSEVELDVETTTTSAANGSVVLSSLPVVDPAHRQHDLNDVTGMRVVARANVYFHIPDDTVGSAAEVVALTHTVVNNMYAAAQATVAAVHCAVGDMIEVTWNTATKTVQPGAKAARFLLKLRQFRDEVNDAQHGAVQMCGAAVAGQSRVLMAGNGISQALTVSTAKWQHALDVLNAFARQHSAFVVDRHSAKHALDLVCQGVAAIYPATRGSSAIFATSQELPSPTTALSDARRRSSVSSLIPGGYSLDRRATATPAEVLEASFASAAHQPSADLPCIVAETVPTPPSADSPHSAAAPLRRVETATPANLLSARCPTSSAEPTSMSMSAPGHAAGGVVHVFEVRDNQADSDEWMYVLDEREERLGGESQVTKAFELCLRGEFDEASTLLGGLPVSFVERSPLAAALRDRVSRLAAAGAPAYSFPLRHVCEFAE